MHPILETQVVSVIMVISINVSLDVECGYVRYIMSTEVWEVIKIIIQLGFRELFFTIIIHIETIERDFFWNLHIDTMRYQVISSILIENIGAISMSIITQNIIKL